MEFLDSELTLVLLGVVTLGITQVAKKVGISPHVALVILSIIGAIGYVLLQGVLGDEFIQDASVKALQIAGTASFTYEVLLARMLRGTNK